MPFVPQRANAHNESPVLSLKPGAFWTVDPRTGAPWPDECPNNPFNYTPRPDERELRVFSDRRSLRRLNYWATSTPFARSSVRHSEAELSLPVWRRPAIPLSIDAARLEPDEAWRVMRFDHVNVGMTLGNGDLVIEITGDDRDEHDHNLAALVDRFAIDLDQCLVVTGWWGHTFIYFLSSGPQYRVARQLDMQGVIVHGAGACVPVAGCVESQGRTFNLRERSRPNFDWTADAPAELVQAVVIREAPLTDATVEVAIRGLNEEWFMAPIEGRMFYWRITHEVELSGKRSVAKLTPHDRRSFCEALEHESITVDNKLRKLADVWLSHPLKRMHTGVVCDPDYELAGQGYFNTWPGLGVEPKPGDWSTIRDFIFDVICGGDAEQFEDLVDVLLAFKVQNPGKRTEVALVLQALKGSGKNTLTDRILAPIFGTGAFYTAEEEHVFGKYTSRMMRHVFVVLDEAFFSGNEKQNSKLKALVTSERLTAEEKFTPGADFRNRLFLVLLGNVPQLVKASADERRFFVPDMVDSYRVEAPGNSEARRKQLTEYWERLYAAIPRELPAFVDYLLHVDIKKHPRRINFQTKKLTEQKAESLAPEVEVLRNALTEGRLPGQWALGNIDWRSHALTIAPKGPKGSVLDAFKDELPPAAKFRHTANETGLFALLREYLGASLKSTNQGNAWVIPALPDSIAIFEAATGLSIDVPGDASDSERAPEPPHDDAVLL